MMKKFKKDLTFGQKMELRFMKYMKNFMGKKNFTWMKGKFKPYDCITDGLKYEIKADDFPSNNIFFEFYCNNIPSGIKSTQAEYWINIFCLKGEAWCIKVKKFNKFMRDNANQFQRRGRSGDGGRVIGYTCDRDWLKENFKDMFIITNDLFKSEYDR